MNKCLHKLIGIEFQISGPINLLERYSLFVLYDTRKFSGDLEMKILSIENENF